MAAGGGWGEDLTANARASTSYGVVKYLDRHPTPTNAEPLRSRAPRDTVGTFLEAVSRSEYFSTRYGVLAVALAAQKYSPLPFFLASPTSSPQYMTSVSSTIGFLFRELVEGLRSLTSSVVHLAYHFGAIRQLADAARGPRETE
jgi:hypothetical protein